MGDLSYLSDVLLKLAVAVVLGSIIGIEREIHDRPAGLRTHVLVCVGSAVYMILSMTFMGPNSDPSRIAAQVATGMGFLGAGTIIRHGNAVRGLTTAASLWAVAAIGLCVGRGNEGFLIAVSTTVFVFVTLRGLTVIEERMINRRRFKTVTVRALHAKEKLAAIQAILDRHQTQLRAYVLGELAEDGSQSMQLALRLPADVTPASLTPDLAKLEGIISVIWD
jgi:putative Mg2+ transporter-C (MgtC) family protein